jgi:cytochrome c-type biogenesis protein CcmH
MNPAYIVSITFGLLVLLAAAFACLPIIRSGAASTPAKLLSGGAALLAVCIIGGGVYLMRGAPHLAVRALSPPDAHDVPALVAAVARRVHERPSDPRGWVLLGKGYLALHDAGDAAAAFQRAVDVAPRDEKPDLLSAYGEALYAASGTVTDDAQAAFRAVLTGRPKDPGARFYLGLAEVERGDRAGALSWWKPLLAEAPADAGWRPMLVDRIAALEGQTGQAPDIAAMVGRLAQRLKARPDDPEGWQRLVQAYAVLGDAGKARAALSDARVALRKNAAALTALHDEAASLKLE